MSAVITILGVFAAAAGAVMIGFGVPINEFSLGNTLIMAGTTALTGGLIVIAIGAAIRQLKRVHDALSRQAARPRAPEMTDPVAIAPERPMTPPRPAPAEPRPMPQPTRAPEQRYAPEAEEQSFERTRPAPPAPSFAEAEEAPPLSPRPHQRPLLGLPEVTAERAQRAEIARHPDQPREQIRPGSAFDNVWPSEGRGKRADAPEFGGGGGPTPRSNGDSRREPPKAAEAGSVTVLKSGVVDGMAYTLYTDGSIEAELAQGVVRFGSIEELRNHLEKSN